MSRIKSVVSRAEWLQHASTWRESGMTQAAYCREHKLNATTFNGWINRDRKTPSSTTQLATVPVVIRTDPPTAPTRSAIILERSIDWQLTLPADVQISWLARLLNELA